MWYYYTVLLASGESKASENAGKHIRASGLGIGSLEGHRSAVLALGADIRQREGSRVAVILFDEVQVFHRPHPRPETDKGALASIRKWLQKHGVEP